jgi:methyl-accepting chemotaxis protein
MQAGWQDSFQLVLDQLDETSEILAETEKVNTVTHSNVVKNINLSIVLALLVLLMTISILGTIIVANISKPLASVVSMIKEIEKGHLKSRLNLKRKDEIGQLGNTMDHYADDLQKFIVEPINKIAVGEFDFELNIKDNEDELSPALKKTVESIKGLVYEANALTDAAINGKLQIRGRAENFNGLYKEIIAGMNKTLDAVIEPIQEASNVLGELEKGNLQVSMNGN